MKFQRRKRPEINSGSMADIAFLLLVFFLITTTIQSDKGLNITLPPYTDKPDQAQIHNRNLFQIHINSKNEILTEGQTFSGFGKLHDDLKTFILNYGRDPELSDDPEKAVVSLQLNRGTGYRNFIEMLDAIQGVYFEIYAQKTGITTA